MLKSLINKMHILNLLRYVIEFMIIRYKLYDLFHITLSRRTWKLKFHEFKISFKTDPQRSVDYSLSQLIELNANYVAKYETESQIRLRQLEKRLEAQRIESSPSESSTQSNSESVSKSNLDLSQELESVGNLFQAKRRKMQERIMRFVRFKSLWTSFRSKTSASSPIRKELSKKVVYLNGDHWHCFTLIHTINS